MEKKTARGGFGSVGRAFGRSRARATADVRRDVRAKAHEQWTRTFFGGSQLEIEFDVDANVDPKVLIESIKEDLAKGAGDRLLEDFKKYLPVGQPSAIQRPPGAKLDALASFVYSKRTYETVFKVMMADLHAEYFEALAGGNEAKARWVRVRGIATFWSNVLAQVPVSAIRLASRLWVASGG